MPSRTPRSVAGGHRLSSWLLVPLLLLPGGCRAAERQPPSPPPALPSGPAAGAPGSAASDPGSSVASDPTHWSVPLPPRLGDAADREPRLWVALAARLGPPSAPPQNEGAAVPGAAPIALEAAAGQLTLTDAGGRRWQAPQIQLHWRWQPLERPVTLRRQVLGPFASHESAEAAAQRWQASGARTLVARPAEWEVWAPQDAPPPEGLQPRLVERRETGRWLLEQRGGQGPATALAGPIRIEAPGGLRWRGGVFGGPFRLLADAHGGWSLIEEVALERYLEGVVPHEIGAASPAAALAAQAVLARTWAVRNQGRYAVDGYHLCADTQCQVYSDPRHAGAAVRQAIAATRGQVLVAGGAPIQAVYHASNGGVAAGLEEAWDTPAVPYLAPFADGSEAFVRRTPIPLPAAALPALLRRPEGANGADHPRFRWRRTLTAERLTAALAGRSPAVGGINRLRALERGPSGRVVALELAGTAGSVVLRRDAIRRTLRELPSTLFTITPVAAGVWQLEGGGFGHGAGLSQAGAIDLAARGWSTARILAHYYPGTVLQALPGRPAVPPDPAAAGSL